MQPRGNGGSGTADGLAEVAVVGEVSLAVDPIVRAEELRQLGADALQVVAPGVSTPRLADAVAALVAAQVAPVGCAVSTDAELEVALGAGASFLVVRATPPATLGVAPDACWLTEVVAEPSTAWSALTKSEPALLAVLAPTPPSLGDTIGLAVGAIVGGCRALRGPDVQVLRRVVDACLPLLDQRADAPGGS